MDSKEYKIIASNRFNNFYDYSLVEYRSSKYKIKIICPEHGLFEQLPDKHLLSKIPCKECRRIIISNKEKNIFIEKANYIHNNFYNYSSILYKNNKTEIGIICPVHGVFYQRPDLHIYQKQGCPFCYKDKLLTTEIFINKASTIHNNKYVYDTNKKITKIFDITCPKHGVFKQNIYNHLAGEGCPDCNNSKGENYIEMILNKLSIKYEKQKKFTDCKFKRCLPFDFYLIEYNICIEYDGNFHFINDSYITNNDNIKTRYCKNNNIKLLRINKSNINNFEKDILLNINFYI